MLVFQIIGKLPDEMWRDGQWNSRGRPDRERRARQNIEEFSNILRQHPRIAPWRFARGDHEQLCGGVRIDVGAHAREVALRTSGEKHSRRDRAPGIVCALDAIRRRQHEHRFDIDAQKLQIVRHNAVPIAWRI